MEDNDTSLSIDLTEPFVIRKIKLFHCLWMNPVAQRIFWHSIRWDDFCKYGRNPGRFAADSDRQALAALPAMFLIAALFGLFEFQHQHMGLLITIITWGLPLSIAVIWRIKRDAAVFAKMGAVDRPPNWVTALEPRLSDSFRSERIDPLLTTPLSDKEIFDGMIFGTYANQVIAFVPALPGGLGLAGGFLILLLISHRIGIDVKYLIIFLLGIPFLVVLGPLNLLLVGACQFIYVGLAMRTSHIASQVSAFALYLTVAAIAVAAGGLLERYLLVTNSYYDLPLVISAASILWLLAMGFLTVLLGFSYRFALRTFGAVRRTAA